MRERGKVIMNTFWPKVVGVVVVVAAISVAVVWVRSAIKQAQTPERTFSDMVKKDKKEMLAEPNATDLASRPAQPQSPQTAEPNKSAQPVEPAKKAEPTTFYFTSLDETEQIEAEQLLAMIPTGRSIGRLPMTGFNLMVETCRQIIEKWPGSIYDYKARRALNQIPERYRERYKITEQELDLTLFTKPRPNTKPYTIKEEN
jgi:hypothetical protein